MLIAAALAATLTLTDRTTVALPSPLVRLGDVARGDRRVAHVIIARLPRGISEMTLSRRALAALICRAVPGVTVAGAEQGGQIVFRAPLPVPRSRPGTFWLPQAPAVRTGDRLVLISRSGPVMVERPVTALQPGQNGRRLFVRDDAGHVSSIQFVGEGAP